MPLIVHNYTDIDLNFGVHPVTGDVRKKTKEQAVIQSVKNLILTNHTEIPFQHEIGSNIRKILFENFSTITAVSLSTEIENVINNFEPRAKLISVQVVADDAKNGYRINITFNIINIPTPVSLSLFLERMR